MIHKLLYLLAKKVSSSTCINAKRMSSKTYPLRTYKANVLHLDENIAALRVWFNSGKSGDLRNIVFSTGTKCKRHGINIVWIGNGWSQLSRHYKK